MCASPQALILKLDQLAHHNCALLFVHASGSQELLRRASITALLLKLRTLHGCNAAL